MSSNKEILRALERERKARKESERILELKSLEIYEQKLEIETLKKRINAEANKKFSQIEKAQRIQEEVFESHPFSIFIYSLSSLKILSVNNTAVKNYGYSKNEFQTKSITDLHLEDEQQLVIQHVESIKSGAYTPRQWSHIKKNGNKIFVKITGVSIEFNNKPARIVIAEDITQQKQLLEKNEIQKKKYINLIDKSSDLIFGVSTNGKFIFVNKVTCNLTCFSESELLSMSFLELVREDYRKRVLSFYQFQLESKTESTYSEFPIVSKDKEIIWLGQNVNISINKKNEIDISVIARVITERRTFEKALIRSEDKYRSIIENMQLGMLETNRNGIIVKAYKSFCKIVGYSPEELEQTNGEFMLDKKSIAIMQEQQKNRFKGQTGVYEIQLICKDGKRKWVIISGAPFYDQNNRFNGSIGIHLDISERKSIEAELTLAKNDAESSLRAKDVFLANISHEIRTPLNAIIGLSELLNQSINQPENKEMIKQVSSASNNLLNLINDLLLLSKTEANGITLKPKAYSIHKVIQESVSIFINSAKKKKLNFEINLDINPNIYNEFDRLRFVQVLHNLISNAIKFTNEGSVKLSAKYKVPNQDIEIKIEDTGIGIPKNELKNVFDGFVQASNNNPEYYGGTGLGLSIVKNIVELMNGTIEINQRKKGICVTLNFSFPEKKELKLIPSSNYNYYIDDLKGINILVAEDNLVNQSLVKKIFSDWNIDSSFVSNGKEAIEIMKERNFDIVLMDIRMPIMNGLTATKIIREERKDYNTKIIALTANILKDENNDYWEAGFNDFLLKPFLQKDLLQLLIDFYKRNLENLKDNLIGFAYGDLKFARTLKSIFIEDTLNRIDKMEQAIIIRDLNKMSNIAHSMKPSLAQLGTEDLQQLNKDFEDKIICEKEIDQKFKTFKIHVNLLINDLNKISF